MADCSVEIAAAVAAIISAVGGAFAAIGAMRSATSAHHSQEAMERSEKRTALRQLVVSGSELEIELQRVVSRAAELKLSYRTHFAFSGSSHHSSETILLSDLENRVSSAQKAADSVKPLTDISTLYDAALDDVNKLHAQIQQVLFLVRSIRDDIERDYSSIEAKNAIYREKAIK